MTDTRFIDKFEENVRLYPDKVILRDQDTSLTFRELDDLSGRVYAYLKQQGIGREDFVMICLPRSVKCYVAMIGVWKAGAAMVMSGEGVPKERERFVYNDCKCKLCLSGNDWNIILKQIPLIGHEITNRHNTCYAVYTSGSEGNPKGVSLEYGILELNASTEPYGLTLSFPDDSLEFIPIPMNFAGAVLALTWLLWRSIAIDVGPISLLKNPLELQRYFAKHNINIATIPPSFFAMNNIKAPSLHYIQLSMEMANHVHPQNYFIVNSYAQSEGYIVSMFVIDREYEVTPIGKPNNRDRIKLLDDDGQPVGNSEMGELCYYNPYFRGYINDEERTRQSFVGEYFRSGDIARINEDGNYVILGRKTDMIKINGNRIEPAELEAAVKRVLGIDWAFAKGFVLPERSFICVYYTADIQIDYTVVREQLLQTLPTYMIPSYFVHVDDVPRLPNGKIDRQAFTAPDVLQYQQEYVAPSNELEMRLCNTMQHILGMERIGINDDFYLLGGDSLRTIRFVSECNIPDLNVSDIYAHRTPSRIAEAWFIKQLS